MFQTNPTGTMLTTPTPTPTSNPTSAIEWNAPTPYSPTPAPSSLVTWSNSNTRATISASGIWAITCWITIDSSSPNTAVITINGGTWNDYDTLGYGASTRTVARDTEYQEGYTSAVLWTGYLLSGDYISCSATTNTGPTTTRGGITISYIPDKGYHWETVAAGVYTQSSSFYSVIWSTTNQHSTYAGFTAANFDQTYGKITVPTDGLYTVSFSFYSTATSGECLGLIMNSFASTDASLTQTGNGPRALGYTCGSAIAGAGSIRATFPMRTTDYIYASVLMAASTNIVLAQSTLSIVLISH